MIQVEGLTTQDEPISGRMRLFLDGTSVFKMLFVCLLPAHFHFEICAKFVEWQWLLVKISCMI